MAKRSQPEPDRFDLAGSPARGQERIAQLADKLGRVYGKTTMLPLSSAFHTRVKRLPFGILLLDWKARGLVINRINRIWGRRSTLKTTLCLRVMRQAQHHCRHCKTPLVIRPADGRRDCACPSPRWWLLDAAEDYAWLPHRAALEIAEGRLPEGAVEKTLKGTGTKRPALRCEPPPGVKGEARDIFFTEMERCEPWRCLYIDSEQTLDDAWIRANGVDPSLVSTIGSRWGEQVYASIEEAILTREIATSKLSIGANVACRTVVTDIAFDYITLRTRAYDYIMLPNDAVSQSAITNHSRPEPLCARAIHVEANYAHPPMQVKEILVQSALAVPGVVAAPAPQPVTPSVALVLNGDICDFLAEPDAAYLSPDRAGAMLERIMGEMPGVGFKDDVLPKFLRHNALSRKAEDARTPRDRVGA